MTLPGVAGRKTANVVLGNAFGVPGITVDTHVRRLSQRMGLTEHEDPDKIERDLMILFERRDWTQMSHVFVLSRSTPVPLTQTGMRGLSSRELVSFCRARADGPDRGAETGQRRMMGNDVCPPR